MIATVCLQYEMCHSTRSCICTTIFNLTNESLFTNDVELANLSNLEVLILRGNHLDGSLPFKGKHSIIYFNCKINFHVTGSSFSISQWAILNIFSWHYLSLILFVDMANFSNLEILDFTGNDFTGSIPPYIGALSSLKAISLSDMELNGTLPIQGKNLLWNRTFQIVSSTWMHNNWSFTFSRCRN